MKKFLCLILALVLVLSSCGVSDIDTSATGEGEAKKVNNDSFGVAYAVGEETDPYKTTNPLNSELYGLICEPLFSLSPSFEATPVLCDSFSCSDMTYVFNIKRDVTFSDGSPLTASDVAYSLRAAAEYGSFYATRLGIIESIRHDDKSATVTVVLKRKNAYFPSLLDIPIIKKDTRDDFFPIGTGLYYPKEDKSTLILRDNHHSGKTPQYKTIRLLGVSSVDELIFEFDTHNISVLSSDPTGNTPLAPLSAAKITNVTSTKMHYLGFNTRKAPLNDRAVRRAIAKAIDRENASVADFALMGRPTTLPLHPNTLDYPHGIASVLDYDGSTKLPIDTKLTILVNSENSGKLAVCKRIAETLTKLGAPTTVRALPFNEYAAALRSGDFTLYYGETLVSPDFDLTSFLGGSLNYGGFYDEGLYSLHSAFLESKERRDDFYRAFCDYVPFAPILFKDTAIYTEDGFFQKATPTAQNIYHGFSDWVIGE